MKILECSDLIDSVQDSSGFRGFTFSSSLILILKILDPLLISF